MIKFYTFIEWLSRKNPNAGTARNKTGNSVWLLWSFVFCMLIAVLISLGGVYYSNEASRLQDEKYGDIAGIAGLKLDSLQEWRIQRLADARRASLGPLVRRELNRLLENPADKNSISILKEQLNINRKEGVYSDVFFVDINGNILLSDTSNSTQISQATRDAIEIAAKDRKEVISDIFRDPTGPVYIDAVAPVYDFSGRLKSFIVLRSNAADFLFPLIQRWPTPSKTAETLLVRRDGDDVLYINELRHRKNNALAFRMPVNRGDLPAAQALMGKYGRFYGKDYRGVDVLAILLSVPDTGWSMVAKVDENEILSDVKYRAWVVSVVISLLIIIIAGSMNVFYRNRNLRERRRAEEEKSRLEERLARAEKMEALGTLAGGVAHDLNNVLGVIVGFSELLLNMGDGDKSDRREYLKNIHDGGRKAAAMVEDLLAMARRGVQGREALNLNNIIGKYKRSPEFSNLLRFHPSVKVITDLDPDILNISGSHVHLEKMLYNLMLNAFEAMPHGGVLTITTANYYLERPIKGYDEVRAGEYVVISISDTGVGISADDIKRIFEPFYTKKIMGRSGTGLGLAVVWGMVKDHNGYINVESEEGKGSVFTLYFPVTRDEIDQRQNIVSIGEYMGKGESILVVDDIKGQRDLAVAMLGKLNYNVSSVSSGEEALDYLRGHAVDLIILDMIMDPGMDGLDTYKNILKINSKQKAVIVSGFSETTRVEDVQASGAGAYVKKPYIMEKLGMAVRNELDRSV